MKMFVQNFVAVVFWLAVSGSTVFASTDDPRVNRDPNKARFVTSDIDNFWRAFDAAGKETDREKKIAIFENEYLNKGSLGLQDFVRLRIKTARDLVETIDRLPKFYASVRPSTLRIAHMEKKMRMTFYRFKRIYPEAAFPDVYFVVGIANTGGTDCERLLFVVAWPSR